MPNHANSDDESLRLIQPSNSAKFQQQGAIEWVDLAKTSISFSVDVLSRFSAAGVDPYTAIVGRAIAQSFKLAPFGRENIRKALMNLQCFGGFGNMIWFGFGIRSLVRDLSTTEQGSICLGLCASLSECYPESQASEILNELTQFKNAPGYLTPSVTEWQSLIRACDGIFATTTFPLRAETLMALHPSERVSPQSSKLENGRGCSNPREIAEALLGVGKVSLGELSSIAIVGGADAGWLAAVSEWLFGLTVTIFDPDMAMLYTNCERSEEAQVQIRFDGTTEAGAKALRSVSKTYHLSDISRIIRGGANMAQTPVASGRLRWKSCLSSAFGGDFERLMKMPHNVGTVIGCVARISRAVARAEPGIDHLSLRGYQTHFSTASGLGFVQHAIDWLPELSSARQHMENGARLTLSEAQAQYETRKLLIRDACVCRYCNEDPDGESLEDDAFCLVVLLDTIVNICWSLCGLSVADNLFPKHSGIQRLYFKRERSSLFSEHEAFRFNHYKFDSAESRLDDALIIFTGCPSLSKEFGASARSHAGICVYLNVLQELSIGTETCGLMHVIPGKIEHYHKPFYCVQDLERTPAGYGTYKDLSGFKDVSLVMKETVKSLQISYKLSERSGRAIYIEPASFVQETIRSWGLVYCGRRNCSPVTDELISEDSALSKLTVNGKDITISRGDDLVRCASYQIGRFSWFRHYLILRGSECMQCCLRHAAQYPAQIPVLIISA